MKIKKIVSTAWNILDALVYNVLISRKGIAQQGNLVGELWPHDVRKAAWDAVVHSMRKLKAARLVSGHPPYSIRIENGGTLPANTHRGEKDALLFLDTPKELPPFPNGLVTILPPLAERILLLLCGDRPLEPFTLAEYVYQDGIGALQEARRTQIRGALYYLESLSLLMHLPSGAYTVNRAAWPSLPRTNYVNQLDRDARTNQAAHDWRPKPPTYAERS